MTAIADPETAICTDISTSRAPAPDSGETTKMTYESPVEPLQTRLALECIIDAGDKRSHSDCAIFKQVHLEPELFHVMGVGSDHVIDSAQYQTRFRTYKVKPEHGMVDCLYIGELSLRQDLHRAGCDDK